MAAQRLGWAAAVPCPQPRGPVRSPIAGTLGVSQVAPKEPRRQPSWMVRSREKWLNATFDVTCEWLECEITSVTTWPPPLPGGESQQPETSPKPNGPLPVKSLSSQAIKMTELPVHAE